MIQWNFELAGDDLHHVLCDSFHQIASQPLCHKYTTFSCLATSSRTELRGATHLYRYVGYRTPGTYYLRHMGGVAGNSKLLSHLDHATGARHAKGLHRTGRGVCHSRGAASVARASAAGTAYPH